MYIKARQIFFENGIVENGIIGVENGLITEAKTDDNSNTIDLGELMLMPGFVDIHVHGGNGFDTMDSSYKSLNDISIYKINEGVTSFCPTTVTTSLHNTKPAITAVDEAMERGVDGAKILGIFLEGPYISKEYKGAHPESFIREIDLDEIAQLLNSGKNIISFAIAPEKPNAIEAIKLLRKKGVNVRIGHSAANKQIVDKAIEAGASVSIHTYNAMSPFTHREPGMAGTVLNNPSIYNEAICDFVHVHPAAIEILYKLKKDKLVLITDCMSAGGLPDGNYKLGELDVTVKDKIARTLEGALAGSTLTVIGAVKNVVSIGLPIEDAVRMAALNPAKALGIDGAIGSIKYGKNADLIGVDRDFQVRFVMIDGKVVLD